MPTGPSSFLLPHDRQLVRTNAALGSADGVTEPSQRGAYIGAPYPSTSNQGNLLPFHAATPWDTTAGTKHPTPAGFTYRLQAGGGLLDTAEFSWRFDDDAATNYRGEIDVRQECEHHEPWGSTSVEAENLFAVYSSAFNRVIVARYNSTSARRWDCKYRNISGPNRTSWDGTFYFPAEVGLLSLGLAPEKTPTGSWAIAWETPDGALRVSYPYISPQGSSSDDMDIWGSTDGGETWTLLQERIVSSTFGRELSIQYVSADTSGDWVRICLWDATSSPAGLITLASSDRGATWQSVVDTPDGLDDTAAYLTGGDQYGTSDIVGVDTTDGLFMRWRKVDTGSNIRVEVASQNEAWAEIYGTAALHDWEDANLQRVNAVRSSNHLAIIMDYTDGSSDGFRTVGFLVSRDDIYASYTPSVSARTDDWTVLAKYGQDGTMALAGQVYYAPARNRIIWTGDSFLHVAGVYSQAAGSPSIQAYTYVSYLGGWDQRPLHTPEAANVGRDTPIWTNKFSSQFGGFSDFSSPYFTVVTTGTPLLNWNPYRYRIITQSTERYYLRRQDSVGSLTNHMADEGALQWTLQVGSSNNLTAPTSTNRYDQPWIGVYTTATASAGETMHVGVHYTEEGIIVYDQGAGSTLYTDASTDFTADFYEYRLSFAKGNVINESETDYFAELCYKQRGVDTAWTSSGLLTLTSNHIGTHLSSEILWGNVRAASTGMNVNGSWADFAFNRGSFLSSPPGYSNPDDLRGAQCSPYARHVAQGIEVFWGGAGGYLGDTFTAESKYEYGVDQLVSPSPQMYWETNGHVTTALIMDAAIADASQSDTVPTVFLHNAVALVGTNFRRCFVDYAGATSFSSPVVSALTVDAAVFSLVVSAATTNSVTVDQSADVFPLLKSNAMAGWMVEVETATAGTTYDGEVLRIREHWDSTIVFDKPVATLSDVAPAGATLTFFPPHMLLPYADHSSAHASGIGARFMRLQLNAGDAKFPSADSGFRVGRLVAGMTLQIEVPLDWEYTDAEEPNVDLFTAVNGVRSAYERGPARKSLIATSVGDVARWRESFRGTIRTISSYQKDPMVLVLDSSSPNDSMLYSRLVSNTELQNAGWRYDSDKSRWFAVGDVSATWEEEV